jgi:hypothetical protein
MPGGKDPAMNIYITTFRIVLGRKAKELRPVAELKTAHAAIVIP